jgi:hypothetical protein
MKPTHHKKEERVNNDEKIEYARSVFLNERRSHIKNGINYKSGDKHNSRVNSNGKEFIKFTKGYSQENVLGYGKITITTNHSISKVLLIGSLDYNLVSISQLYEMDYYYLFTNKGVTVFRRSNGSYVFSGILRGKLYLVDFIPKEMKLDKCLIVKTNMGWL